MLYALALAAGLICDPLTGPQVIDQPGTYDFSCGGRLTGGSPALTITASDVTVIWLTVEDAYRCVEIRGSRVTLIGGWQERCTKIATQIVGPVEDVRIENVEFRDSGNGVLAYPKGEDVQRRIAVIGSTFTGMRGAVDGHAIGFQSVTDGRIVGNYAEDCQRACISLYWWNGSAQHYGNLVERNVVRNNGGYGISLGGSNGDGTAKWGNVVRYNTVYASQPLYLKGNKTDDLQRWAIEAYDNEAPGASAIGNAATSGCPKVFAARNVGASWSGVQQGC